MIRIATPGFNQSAYTRIYDGKTNYAHGANSPKSSNYSKQMEQENKRKKHLQKKCKSIVESELAKTFKELPLERQFITIKGKKYGFSELREELLQSIDGCDIMTLTDAKRRYSDLTFMSFVRFLIGIIS